MSIFNPDWEKAVQASAERRKALRLVRPPLTPHVATRANAEPRKAPPPAAPPVTKDHVRELYAAMTWAYHTEATARTDQERETATRRRLHINSSIMEISR